MVAGVALWNLQRVERDWEDFIEVVHGKQRRLANIQELMGYGGMIHNFKNYLLRGEPHYLDTALSKARETLEVVDGYGTLKGLQNVETSSLQQVRALVVAYSEAAERTRVLRGEGVPTAEIDAEVKIDDEPYLAGIAALSRELSRQAAVQSARVSEQVSRASILLALIGAAGGVFFVIFGTSLKRGIQTADDALRLEILERREVEEQLKRSRTTLEAAEALRDSFVEMALTAQEEERRRISRELHDEAGQALSSLIVGLEQIKESNDLAATGARAEKLQTVAEGIIDELARIARGLHPRLLEDLGFTEAVEQQAAELARLHRLKIDTQFVGLDDAQLPGPIATVLYRIIQEALTNVVKHANATAINLVVTRDQSMVRVIVEDDGEGFDASDRSGGGMGLLGIGERVKMLNGTIDIESTGHVGTTLAVRIPLASVSS